MSRIVYVNGAFLPEADAKISIFDRGFLFADGVYEVTPIVNGRLVDYDAHMERLDRSLKELRMAHPCSAAEIRAMHEELVKRNSLKEGIIYMQVTRGVADRQFNFPKEATRWMTLTRSTTIRMPMRPRNHRKTAEAAHRTVENSPSSKWRTNSFAPR